MTNSKAEIAVYAAFTSVWWISSITVLLPFLCILKFSKYFRDRWFSFFFIYIIKPVFEAKVTPFRKKAFDLLKNKLPQTSQKNPVKVLEIGIGSGGNLDYYPKYSRLTPLDINKNFETHLRKNQSKYPNIIFDRLVISFAEDMRVIRDSSMDVVISTHVLCCVESVRHCLKEINRVLKPEGKFLFLEHVGYPESDWSFTVQRMANPLWKIFFNGCDLTKNLAEDIKKCGFKNVTSERVDIDGMMLFVKPQIYGLAIK